MFEIENNFLIDIYLWRLIWEMIRKCGELEKKVCVIF